MKFSLAQIRKNTANNRSFHFEEDISVSDLKQLYDDIRDIGSAHVTGNCIVRGEQIIFTLRIQGEMILPCARTLVDVPYSFDINAIEIFSTSQYLSEDEKEEEIHPIQGEVLDLAPYIKENIILDIPFRVISEEADKENNVPREGHGWQVVSKSELSQEQTIDPRMKKLQSLLKNHEKEK
ncbi:MAG TPA: YceD family protein [Cerasibacillus sp.]|uniref:YceD family protein n=1 Tax=Cerasibacillus sp. TaxID=2498711 RepID=UPI002F3EB3E3